VIWGSWSRAPVLGCLLVLAGCGATDRRGPAEPQVEDISVVRSAADLELPLDQYIESPNELGDLARAANLSGRRCMRSLGFDWPVSAPRPSGRLFARNGRRYGLLTKKEATSYGYHVRRSRLGADTTEWEARETAVTSTALDVWTGRATRVGSGKSIPEGGCAGSAMRELEQGAPEPPPLQPQIMANDALAASERDSRVRAVFARWSTCMRRTGFDYGSPWEANDDPRWKTPRPRAEEIKTAIADVGCRFRTNLVGVWHAVERAYQRRLVERYTHPLALVRRVLAIRHRNAMRILRRVRDR
jgi:hypothetical protein